MFTPFIVALTIQAQPPIYDMFAPLLNDMSTEIATFRMLFVDCYYRIDSNSLSLPAQADDEIWHRFSGREYLVRDFGPFSSTARAEWIRHQRAVAGLLDTLQEKSLFHQSHRR